MNPIIDVTKRMLLAMAALACSFSSLAAVDLDQQNLGLETAGTAVGSDYVGQLIVVGKTGVLDRVDFAVRKFDGYSFGDITFQIRSADPGFPVLAEKTFPNVSIEPVTSEFTTFDVASLNLNVVAGQGIVLAVTSSNNSGSPFPVALSDDTYFSGGAVSSADGTSWSGFGLRDVRFSTYVADAVEIVGVDVKPGSDTNCVKINGHGVIPVAILGSETLDVADIDPWSLTFGAMEVRVRGKKGPLCHFEDANGDAYDDLLCQFEDDASMWEPNADDTATLKGSRYDGSIFEGTDTICVN